MTEEGRNGKKPLCYVGIAMHPEARRKLEEKYDVTEDGAGIGEASAAICYGVPKEWTVPGAAAHLRAIGCHSCGEEELQWVKRRGIRITLADSLWRTVAEHTLALMMAAARNLIPADREIREGKWQEHVRIKERFSGFDFQGKTLGILGMGQIGTQLADMVRGFRMRVIYHDIVRLPENVERELKISCTDFEGLMEQSDYLCILVPLVEETRGLVGKEAFARMKRGCILVNTARAGILDEEAFLKALEDGTLAAAALDVFWDEGCVQKKELTERGNVVLTPHLGGSTLECDMTLVRGVTEGMEGESGERPVFE